MPRSPTDMIWCGWLRVVICSQKGAFFLQAVAGNVGIGWNSQGSWWHWRCDVLVLNIWLIQGRKSLLQQAQCLLAVRIPSYPSVWCLCSPSTCQSTDFIGKAKGLQLLALQIHSCRVSRQSHLSLHPSAASVLGSSKTAFLGASPALPFIPWQEDSMLVSGLCSISSCLPPEMKPVVTWALLSWGEKGHGEDQVWATFEMEGPAGWGGVRVGWLHASTASKGCAVVK